MNHDTFIKCAFADLMKNIGQRFVTIYSYRKTVSQNEK